MSTIFGFTNTQPDRQSSLKLSPPFQKENNILFSNILRTRASFFSRIYTHPRPSNHAILIPHKLSSMFIPFFHKRVIHHEHGHVIGR